MNISPSSAIFHSSFQNNFFFSFFLNNQRNVRDSKRCVSQINSVSKNVCETLRARSFKLFVKYDRSFFFFFLKFNRDIITAVFVGNV